MAVVNGLILSEHHLLLKQTGDGTHRMVQPGDSGAYEAPVKVPSALQGSNRYQFTQAHV